MPVQLPINIIVPVPGMVPVNPVVQAALNVLEGSSAEDSDEDEDREPIQVD